MGRSQGVLVGVISLVAVGSLAANALLYQRYSSRRPLLRLTAAAPTGGSIGDRQVTRKEYQDALDIHYGKVMLSRLVYAKVVRQAAIAAKVVPTEEELTQRIAAVTGVRPELGAQANRDPLMAMDMRDDVRTQMELENLRLKGVTVTDAEVQSFYDHNRAALALPEQAQTSIIVSTDRSEATAAAEMLRQKIPLDVIARRPRLKVVGANGWVPDWEKLPTKDRDALSAAVGRVPEHGMAVIPVKDLFFVVRVERRQKAGTPPLNVVRPRVERLARLAKAPSDQDTLARLFHEAGVKFEVDRYANYFEDIRRRGDELARPGAKDGQKTVARL